MNIDTVDSLVTDWLIRCGYQRTFTKLPISTCESLQKSAESLSFRAGVVRLIKEGLILEAIEEIQKLDGFYLNEVLFLLKLQHFIELIRQRNTPAALSWIQNSVLPSVIPVFEPVLQDHLGILAYSDPENSPLAYFFEKPGRYSHLAELVNTALFNFLNKEDDQSEPPIEILLKQVQAIDQLVQELGGFSNDMDDRKWAKIQQNLTFSQYENNNNSIKNDNNSNNNNNFIKMIKND